MCPCKTPPPHPFFPTLDRCATRQRQQGLQVLSEGQAQRASAPVARPHHPHLPHLSSLKYSATTCRQRTSYYVPPCPLTPSSLPPTGVQQDGGCKVCKPNRGAGAGRLGTCGQASTFAPAILLRPETQRPDLSFEVPARPSPPHTLCACHRCATRRRRQGLRTPIGGQAPAAPALVGKQTPPRWRPPPSTVCCSLRWRCRACLTLWRCVQAWEGRV